MVRSLDLILMGSHYKVLSRDVTRYTLQLISGNYSDWSCLGYTSASESPDHCIYRKNNNLAFPWSSYPEDEDGENPQWNPVGQPKPIAATAHTLLCLGCPAYHCLLPPLQKTCVSVSVPRMSQVTLQMIPHSILRIRANAPTCTLSK